MQLNWEPDHSIRVRLDGDTAVVSANRQGLRSLANHLLALAEEPPGSHLHLDRYNALEDDSSGLILEKTEERKERPAAEPESPPESGGPFAGP